MKTITRQLAVFYVFLLSIGHLSAIEYFVAKRGNDIHDGKSRDNAFATISKGISILKPGDTLTICPGEYAESVTASISGTKEMPILIRAEYPGTAIIRGDKPLKAKFSKLSDLKYTYACKYTAEIKGIIERDSLSQYSLSVSPKAVDKKPGQYFYDKAAGKIFIHTTDSLTPARHHLSLSGVVGKNGLYIQNTRKYGRSNFTKAKEEEWVKYVTIDGLAFTGFAQLGNKKEIEGTGLGIYFPRNCIIKNCIAFLNGHGIVCVGTPIIRNRENALKRDRIENCVIEECIAYGNADYGIVITGSVRNSVIRNCITFKSSGHDMRFYSGVIENCTLQNNIAFMPGTIWIKPNFRTEQRNRAIGNVCNVLDMSVKEVIERNIAGRGGSLEKNIRAGNTKKFDFATHFADPLHLDYRLQSDSSLRGTGRAPHDYRNEVFYVSPDGNDNNEGTSVKKAWKSIAQSCAKAQAGQTVYILPGRYQEELNPTNSGGESKPLVFRKRGSGEVIVNDITIRDKSFITLNGLTVLADSEDGISINNGSNIVIEQCVIAKCEKSGIIASNTEGLKISHCTLASNKIDLELKQCGKVVVTANIFSDNAEKTFRADKKTFNSLWSDFNSFSSGLIKWQKTTGLDIHSIEAIPEFVDPGKNDYHLNNAYVFNGLGPLAMPVGPYEKVCKITNPRIDNLKVTSLTDTTANITCETPGALSQVNLQWGITPECKNKLETGPKGLVHYFSLCGLSPNTKYYLRAESKAVSTTNFTDGNSQADTHTKSEAYSFTTPAKKSAPVIYNVATNGNDKNSGLSEQEAFRTINHAAAKIKAGDTIIIHDGVYNENVIISATGEKDQPILIKAKNPGKVFLKGNGIIRTAIEMYHKSWIILDGLYIINYNRDSPFLNIVGGSNNTLRRCIIDGRKTIPKRFVFISSDNLLIENCVFRNAWNYLSLDSKNAILKNNVFYGTFVGGVGISKSKCLLTHNIICDQVPKKRVCPLVYIHNYGSLTDEYNCYFTRLPEKEKTLYWVRRRPAGRWITFKQFKEESGQGTTSFFDNPGMKILKEYKVLQGDMTKKAHKFVTQEINLDSNKEPIISLYDEFFATNPKCVKAADGKPIGLDLKVFEK